MKGNFPLTKTSSNNLLSVIVGFTRFTKDVKSILFLGCFQENLRLFPPAFRNQRYCNRDAEVEGKLYVTNNPPKRGKILLIDK